MTLDPDSMLYDALCKKGENGLCNYSINVFLDMHLTCFGKECDVEMPRVVRLGDVFYEYIRPPCVNLPFNTNVSTVRGHKGEVACADKKDNESVMMACCKELNSDVLYHTCSFSGSRVSYDENTSLCSSLYSGRICDGSSADIEITAEGVLYPNQNGVKNEYSCVPTRGQVTVSV